MPVAIILAAGASRRLGEPKQLVRLGSETLLERTVRVAHSAALHVVVVLGSEAERIQAGCDLGDAVVVVNAGWEEGMGSSLRAGLEATDEPPQGTLVLTCDQPAVNLDHLRALIEAGRDGAVVASGYAGAVGVPAFFPPEFLPRLRALDGDAGARTLLDGSLVLPLPGGELDIDTAEALAEARQRWD